MTEPLCPECGHGGIAEADPVRTTTGVTIPCHCTSCEHKWATFYIENDTSNCRCRKVDGRILRYSFNCPDHIEGARLARVVDITKPLVEAIRRGYNDAGQAPVWRAWIQYRTTAVEYGVEDA